MNSNIFKVIFSKRTGELVAVSEITKGQGKSESSGTSGTWLARLTLNPIAFVLMLTTGNAVFVQSAQAQIVADPNAPKTQQPTVLNTASGVVQVNIQTPSAAGVSMNQYNRFDVTGNGAILNNSRTNVNTQTAGWVQGNPWLATGPARVIVNQVNSANPSLLNGYVEVAGQRAEVIIANPAGINVSGGGFINASRTTLTTGTPIITGGSLEGYRVTQGIVNIDGSGLDTSKSDYTDILARGVKVNAGIWANNLKVTAGANQIDATNSTATAIAGTGETPTYAIDTGALGGMYSSKIVMVGSERGLGVNNQGQIAALAGSVAIDVNGLLTNSGTIGANGSDNALTINAQGVKNSGTLSSQGNTQIQTTGETQNSGNIAAGRELTVHAKTIQNTNGTLNGQRVELTAESLDNTNAKIQQTGATQSLALNTGNIVNINNGLIGYAPVDAPIGGSTGGTTSGSNSSGTSTPTTAAGGGTTTVVQPAPAPLGNGAINITNTVLNDNGQITANGGVDLTSTNGLINSATLNLNKLKVTGSQLDNSKGTITTTQADIDTTNIINTSGKLGSNGNVNLTAQNLTNSAGQITASGTTTANIAQTILNDDGTIASNDTLTINATTLNSNGGTVASIQKDATIKTANAIQNSKGSLQAATALNVTSGGLDNTDGVVDSKILSLDTGTAAVTNTRGKITGDAVSVKSGAISSDAGLIQGSQSLAIDTHGQTLTNTNSGAAGGIISGGALDIASGDLDNTLGNVSSAQNLKINATNVDSSQGKVNSGAQLDLTAKSLTNTSGQVTAATALNGNIAQSVSNNSGLIASNDALALNASTLDNTNGTVASSKGAATVTTSGAITNIKGSLQAASSLDVTSNGLDNSDGKINAVTTQINAQTGALNNTRGSIAGKDVHVDSGAMLNDAGLVQGSSSLVIDTHGQTLTNANSGATGGLISGGTLDVASGDLTNSAGYVGSKGAATIHAAQITNGSGSQITGQSTLDLTGNNLDNRGGSIETSGSNTISVGGGTVNNDGSLIRSGGTATINSAKVINTNTNAADKGIEGSSVAINANDVDNTSGAVHADEDLTITGSGSVNNTSGLISSAKNATIKDPNATKTLAVTNTNGTIIAGVSNSIDAKSLTGDGKVLSKQDLSIALNDDFTNNATVQAANNLTLSTAGNVTNNGKLTSGGTTTINGQNVVNVKYAEISGAITKVNATNSVTNRGLIDGGDTVIKAGNTVDNIGTGRIYGTHLSIGANTVNNHPEIISTSPLVYDTSSTPTIAARERLDIGAQNINNLEGSLIFSAGKMAIGGALDADNNATGKANVVNNRSSTIESVGDMSIAANQLNNINDHFSVVEELTGTEHVLEHAASTDPNNRMRGGVWDRHTDDKDQQYADYTTVDGQNIVAENWNIYDYDLQTYKERVNNSAPAKIIAGGNMTISGDHWVNDKSQILAGGDLNTAGLTTLENKAAIGNQRVETEGTNTYSYSEDGHWYKGAKRYRRFEDTSTYTSTGSSPNVATIRTTFELPVTQATGHAAGIGSGRTVSDQSTNAVTDSATGANAVNGSTATVATGGGAVSTGGITSVAATNTTDPTLIKTGDVNTNVPNSSLFAVNPNAAGYLIETDPRFASYRNWLSSDWMLGALNLDPANMHKRLGDGFYEQKLVREQIAQLTGRRYLNGQSNDDEQYKSLMNAGVTFANQYNLRPGVALTAEQMARLTSDIVWLVEQEVTLPNGTKTTALVPKVYVAVKPGDIDGTGALISANRINLNLTGDLANSGTIAGRTVTQITAENLNNLGGRITGNQVDLTARTDLNNIGGVIDANTSLAARAGRDVNIVTTTQTSGSGDVARTNIDRVAGLYVGDGANKSIDELKALGYAPTTLLVSAGRNANLIGADIANAGEGGTLVMAKNDVNLDTVKVASSESTTWDADNWRKEAYTQDVGTNVNTVGNVRFDAGHDITATAAYVNSEQGQVAATAKNNITIQNGQSTAFVDEAHKHTADSGLSQTTITTRDTLHSTTAQGSTFSGETVLVKAGNVANIQGSDVVSTYGTSVSGTNGVNITNATNTVDESHFKQSDSSGLMAGGGASIFIGSKMKSTDTQTHDTRVVSSTVGSLQGDTTVAAQNGTINIIGSNVSAPVGNIAISGQAVNIEAAHNTSTYDSVEKTEQKGVTVAVSAPVVDAALAVANAAKTVGKSKNDRVNAMAAANTAWDAYKAVEAVGAASDALTKGADGTLVNVSITYGQQKSENQTHAKSSEVVGSNVNGGGHVSITATGAGENSNIKIAGSDVYGGTGTSLKADNKIDIVSDQSTSEEHTSNKSSGFNAGVAVNISSSGWSAGITAGGNVGKGKGDGESVTQRNSHVGSGGLTSVESGGTTTIAGGQVTGKRVEVDAKDLNIVSLQDTSTYKSKQMNASAQVTVGYGFSASGSYSQSKINADYASVGEQSGIIAGDGGYKVNVKDRTNMVGGIVTSSQSAEDAGLNSFTTGTLTTSDVQNHADYKGSSMGISASGGMNGSGKQAEGSHWAPQGSTAVNSKTGEMNTGKASTTVSKSIGYGSDSDHQNGTTASGINTKNITITDAAGQAATGKSAAQAIADVQTATTSDTVIANSGSIANNFDKQAVQDELDLQVKVTQEFDQNRQEARAEINSHEKDLRDKADKETDLDKKKELLREADQWKTGGLVFDSFAGALYGPNSNGITGTIAQVAAPHVANAIGEYFDKPENRDNEAGHVLAHTILGAALAAATGNNALVGGLSAGGAEALTPALSHYLYGESDPSKLTSDQKSTVSAIVGLGGAATGAAIGNSTDAVSGSGAAQNAVDNNFLGHLTKNVINACENASDKAQCMVSQFDKNREADRANANALAAACTPSSPSYNVEACKTLAADAGVGKMELYNGSSPYSGPTAWYPRLCGTSSASGSLDNCHRVVNQIYYANQYANNQGFIASQTGRTPEMQRANQVAWDAMNGSGMSAAGMPTGGSPAVMSATKDERGSFRRGTVQDAWDNASPGSTSNTKACPTCNKDVKVPPNSGQARDWDVDHQPPWKSRDTTNLSRKEVLDLYNKGTRLECPSCNRGRGAKPAK